MKTLFITHHYLSGNNGGSFASRAFINSFAEISEELTLLYPIKAGQNLFDNINPKVVPCPVKYDSSKWKKALDILVGKIHRFFDIANEINAKEKFDLVVFDTSLVSFRLIDKFKASGAKILVIHHNYQYEYFRDNTRFPLSVPTLFWCRIYERQAIRKADMNLTLTPQDVVLLAKNYNGGNRDNIKSVGVFEFCPSLPKTFADEANQCKRFVITGNLSDIQTESSLVPWLNDYFPILKEELPEASLVVAGKNPGSELRNICEKLGASLIPSPESMDEIIKEADCYICPTCLGGGLKLRVLDGLKWGLPVVSHEISARGYDSFVEKGYMFSYSNPEGFRQSLKSLKRSIFIKKDIYEEYCSEFSFDSGLGRLRRILEGMDMKQKLLIFHPYLAPYRLDLYNRFLDDFKVKVLLSGSKSEIDTLAFDLEAVNSQAKFDYSYFSDAFYFGRHPISTVFWKSIKKFRPNIVLSHEYGINTIAAILVKPYFKYRQYLTCDDSLPMATGYGLLRKILRNYVVRHVDGIICVHPEVAGYLQDKYRRFRCKFLYFPIIQDDALLEGKINKASRLASKYMDKYGLQGKRVLLYVGRLSPEKNIDLAIDSYRLVSDADNRFVIVGSGSLENLLKEKVRKYDLCDRVIFTGPLSGESLFAWYYLSDLFVLASRQEAFGAVVNEALSGGCRCLVSDHCGSSSLITTENGKVFESGNVDQLSSMMKCELSNIQKSKVHKSLMPHTFVSYYNDLKNNF